MSPRYHPKWTRVVAALAAFTGIAVVASACLDSQLPEPPDGRPSKPMAASPADAATLDLGAVMRRVRAAFRPHEGIWAGGERSYGSRVTADGMTLTPRHRRTSDDRGDSVLLEGAPVTFRTTALGRGQAGLPIRPVVPSPRDDGGVELVRDHVVESFVNGPEGVEQSWVFDVRPPGDEDLIVRVAVEGQEYAGASEMGHHFVDASTGVGARYGVATWIDARGTRTPVHIGFDGSALVLTVPAEIVEGSDYPALLDPNVSPEFGIDNPVASTSIAAQSKPAIAFDGTNYLVVWEDDRAGGMSSTDVPSFGNRDVYATRVSTTGTVLDPYGLAISTAANSQSTPAVAFNGTDYFVVWSDLRGAFAAIYGTRVTQAGTVSSPSGLTVMATANISLTEPAVASDGANFLITWNRAGDIWGARVSPLGSVLDPSGFLVSGAVNTQSQPAVAFDGTNYLAVWADTRNGNSDIYGSRISTAGFLLDVIPVLTGAGTQAAPDIAWGGTSYLAVWEDMTAMTIGAARIAPNGTVLDPTGVVVTTGAQAPTIPAVRSDGTDFLVAWKDFRNGASDPDIYGARVGSDATVIDALGFAIAQAPGVTDFPALAFDGTNYVAVWQDARTVGADVYGARIATNGTVIDGSGIVMSPSANDEDHPAVAYGGGKYLVVWSDYRGGTSRNIFGAPRPAPGARRAPGGRGIWGGRRAHRKGPSEWALPPWPGPATAVTGSVIKNPTSNRTRTKPPGTMPMPGWTINCRWAMRCISTMAATSTATRWTAGKGGRSDWSRSSATATSPARPAPTAAVSSRRRWSSSATG